ncbi:hypothetical protein B0T24DRAFT_598204 [Lasiosphaeria ovina]|uniref:BTB domain-containing protein n=1 Tax=Lasiosphaeria ovina TaxID=92902 RepID=A0AAE0JW91_9PEZI|nr:hypothetical protein B0T24DRAFT_598204 [Lasiosphaeria ovina]
MPEMCLWFSMLGGSVLLPAPLWWMAWSCYVPARRQHLGAPRGLRVFFGYGLLTVFSTILLYTCLVYGVHSASALADPFNGAQQAGSWAVRETLVAVVTCNLPMVFPLVNRWVPSVVDRVIALILLQGSDSTDNDSNNTNNNANTNINDNGNPFQDGPELVGPRSAVAEEDVFMGIDKPCNQLELDRLWEAVLSLKSLNDRRLARQRQQDEVRLAQAQVAGFFKDTVLKFKMYVDPRKVDEIKWPHDNAIFTNYIIRADADDEEEEDSGSGSNHLEIPIAVAPVAKDSTRNGANKPKRSVLYPVYKAFLIRSPYFETIFSNGFIEAKDKE